jgi:hypothetical protein
MERKIMWALIVWATVASSASILLASRQRVQVSQPTAIASIDASAESSAEQKFVKWAASPAWGKDVAAAKVQSILDVMVLTRVKLDEFGVKDDSYKKNLLIFFLASKTDDFWKGFANQLQAQSKELSDLDARETDLDKRHASLVASYNDLSDKHNGLVNAMSLGYQESSRLQEDALQQQQATRDQQAWDLAGALGRQMAAVETPSTLDASPGMNSFCTVQSLRD